MPFQRSKIVYGITNVSVAIVLYIFFKVIEFPIKFTKLDVDASHMLDPIYEFMDKNLSTGISIFATCIRSKGNDADLNVGSVRRFDKCGSAGVTKAGAYESYQTVLLISSA